MEWELKQQCFLYIPACLPFSVVKITENIHGIDLLKNEGFDFVKSRTEKKKKLFRVFTANRSFCLSAMIDIEPSIN